MGLLLLYGKGSRALTSFVPPAAKSLVVLLQVYILAAIVIVLEFFFEVFRPRSHRECIDGMLASRFLKQRHEIPRITPPVAVVSGADGTIGTQVVRLLLKLGFSVMALVGSASKMRDNMTEFTALVKGRVKIFQINLAEPLRARTYLEQLMGKLEEVDLVVLAAGTLLTPGPKEIHGVDHHIWVNVVSQAALLRLLEPKLVDDARIVALSSVCGHLASTEADDKATLLRPSLGAYEAYARSKLFLATYISHLAKTWMSTTPPPSDAAREHPKIMSVHPGVIGGGLYRNTWIPVRWIIDKVAHLFRSPELGAALVLHTAIRDDAESGQYYEDSVPTSMGAESSGRNKEIYDAISASVDDFLS